VSEDRRDPDLVPLAEFTSNQRAFLLQALLRDAGIASEVCARMSPEDDSEAEALVVFIPPNRRQEAAQILTGLQAALAEDAKGNEGFRESYQSWAFRGALKFALILLLIALIMLLIQFFRELSAPGAVPPP